MSDCLSQVETVELLADLEIAQGRKAEAETELNELDREDGFLILFQGWFVFFVIGGPIFVLLYLIERFGDRPANWARDWFQVLGLPPALLGLSVIVFLALKERRKRNRLKEAISNIDLKIAKLRRSLEGEESELLK